MKTKEEIENRIKELQNLIKFNEDGFALYFSKQYLKDSIDQLHRIDSMKNMIHVLNWVIDLEDDF